MSDDSVYPWAFANGSYTMVTSKPVYFLVIASQDRFYDSVKFLMSGLSMTSFHVGIFKPTTDTSLTRIMDLGNVKSQMSGAGPPYLRTITLPDPLDAVAGEKFYVGLLAVGGTMPLLARSTLIAGTESPAWGNTNTIPKWEDLTALDSGTQSAFSNATETITTSSGLNARVWGALGTAAAPVRPDAFAADNFNQINTSQLVLPWAGRAGAPQFGVYNQTASPQTSASPAFNYWAPSMRNDDHYIQARLGVDMATVADRTIDLYLGLRSAAMGGTGPAVKLHVKPAGTRQFRIITVATAYNNASLTQRQAADPVPEFADGDVVKLVADDSLYTAFYNDVPLVSWNDSGVLHPVGIDYQRVNIMTSATSVENLQIVDNFEAGAFGGGVQLIGLTGIPSGEAFGTPTFQNNVDVAPAKASLVLVGATPTIRGGNAIQSAQASLRLTGYAPTVASLTPSITETNTNQSNAATPENAIGVWVTLRGGGGGGGGGANTSSAVTRYGGGGGGGGALINRFFIPRNLLGATYSVTRGIGGSGGGPGPSSGSNGTSSTFVSGSVTLTAGGGERGGGGSTSQPSSSLGDGGVASYSGITPTNGTVTGSDGGRVGGGSNASTGSPGGGSGGRLFSNNTTENGFGGGDSAGASGGGGSSTHGHAGGTSSNHVLYGGGAGGGGASNNTPGNYAGGDGGSYGAGGGGAGPTTQSANNEGGDGAPGYTNLEWVIGG